MQRFFVAESSFEDECVRLSPEQAHQVCHVLRLTPGDSVVVLDDAGFEYDAVLQTVGGHEVVCRITEKRPAPGEPQVQITLFQSLLARDKFEWVLQKGTEVGATRFVPVLTQRSIVRARRIEEKKFTRWRRILTEAAEQSHRGRVPQLEREVDFAEAASRLGRFDCSVIAAPSDNGVSLKDALESRVEKPSSVALLIGPEGGLTDAEIALACENSAVRVSLGPRILRTETAAVVASALILYELGQMMP
ncbi:MAG: 16S rRNA (uracil(1498)-N(3))-methyltransferase [Sedimentisphaerales bacterium]|nr:16S rRNA (uracil(1498)-N(3))-methyltransferase [Sedimentisphaerales bacterium]